MLRNGVLIPASSTEVVGTTLTDLEFQIKDETGAVIDIDNLISQGSGRSGNITYMCSWLASRQNAPRAVSGSNTTLKDLKVSFTLLLIVTYFLAFTFMLRCLNVHFRCYFLHLCLFL